eukprot:4201052-Alexandrium_andersonii.AAC.2
MFLSRPEKGGRCRRRRRQTSRIAAPNSRLPVGPSCQGAYAKARTEGGPDEGARANGRATFPVIPAALPGHGRAARTQGLPKHPSTTMGPRSRGLTTSK